MSVFLVLILSFVAAINAATEGTRDWGYISGSGLFLPSDWHKAANSSLCNGNRQSPINLQYSMATYDSEMKEIQLADISTKLLLANKGTTIQVDFLTNPTYTFGGVGTIVKVAQVHWHWGQSDSEGSEHTLEDKSFPLVAHFVGFDSKYSDLTTAVGNPDSLYVIGVFFKIGAENSILKPIIDEVSNVKNKDDNKTLSTTLKMKDLLPEDLKSYYRYLGSLTTPPCLENVFWTVLNETLTISSAQVAKFREAMYGPPEETKKMVKNFRPVIKLDSKAKYDERKFRVSWKKGSRQIGFSVSLIVFFGLTAIWKYFI